MKKLTGYSKKLMDSAVKEFNWFIHNCSTDRSKALKYAQHPFEYGLYAGLIDEEEMKSLCLLLPFYTYLR